ncbi:MAG: hypothetical protein AB2448_01845 [Moorella sp. (in: firmicutes)]
MKPVRIRAYLLDGRIAASNKRISLDGLLYSLVIRRDYPELAYTPIVNTSEIIEADLPLKKIEDDETWYWACSLNQAEPIKEYTLYWHKRFDDNYEQYIDFKGKRGKVDDKRGVFKAYRMPLNILLMPYLEWFVVGDMEELYSLLKNVVALGKKTSQGLGLVKEWEVTEWDEDWSVLGPGNRLMRPVLTLPQNAKNARRAIAGIRPPYWYRGNIVEAWMPL